MILWNELLISLIILDEKLNTEEEYDAQDMDTEINEEKHLAIVEVNQKFKVLGDFTLFTAKVYGILRFYLYGTLKIKYILT